MLVEKVGLTHEDERRILIEWFTAPDGAGRMAQLKVVAAKQTPTRIGRHYHRRKTEVFYLLWGRGTVNGEPIEIGTRVLVLPGEVHAFDLEAGSVLLGAATAPYDPDDEVPA
jgi:quercetin dioxygenase-like cupin family protein